jgi:cell wall-associated NlpC family hydrolase
VATARFTRPLTLSAVGLAAAFAALVGPATVTSAAPQLSIGQVQARVDALNTQAEKITERYNAARDRLTVLNRQQRVTGDRLSREQTRLIAMRSRISATAAAAYRTGGFGEYVLGSATDPQSFLDQAVTLDALSRGQSEQFAAAAAAGHAVKVAKASYDAQAAAVRQALSGITTDKSRIEGFLGQARHLLASLKAADRARLAAMQSQSTAQQVSLRTSYHGPASGRAAAAVRFAYAQLGKPYVYGASGPNSYDCSGLTMRSWGAAGVGLAHNAAMQQSETHYVSQADLQPGDLVFFGSPAYHVGMYVGGGNIIEAPHTGDVVKIVSLSYMPSYSGAGRP